MRIALLLPFRPTAVLLGIEREAVRVASGLAAAGEEVTLVATDRSMACLPDHRGTNELHADVHLLLVRGYVSTRLRGVQPSGAPAIVPRLRATVAAHDVCVVWNAGWPLTLLASGIGSPRWPPVIYRSYWHPPRGRSSALNRVRTRVMGAAFSRAAVLVAATAAEAGALMRVVRSNVPIEVAPPGVDPALVDAAARAPTRAALGIDAGALVVTQLGRPGPFKGTDQAIAAVAALRRDGHEAVLLLIGAISDRRWLDQHLARHAAHGWVLTAGAVDDRRKSELLMAADVLVMLSDYEALGFVALEAAAHGVGVVSYDDFPSAPLIAQYQGRLITRKQGPVGVAHAVASVAREREIAPTGTRPRDLPGWAALTERIQELAGALYSRRASRLRPPDAPDHRRHRAVKSISFRSDSGDDDRPGGAQQRR